jgi:hypothetical protein
VLTVDGLVVGVGVGLDAGGGVAVAPGDVDGAVLAEAGVEGEAAGVAVLQPASRAAEPARAAMAIRIRADVISLPPSRRGQGGHAWYDAIRGALVAAGPARRISQY